MLEEILRMIFLSIVRAGYCSTVCECVLRLRGVVLHLPLPVRVVLWLNTCGLVSVLICVPAISGA